MELRRFGAIVFRTLGVMLLCMGTAYAAPATAGGPCSLLTTQQVSAVLGASFGKPIPAGAKVCEWIATGPSGPNGTKKVELVLVPANDVRHSNHADAASHNQDPDEHRRCCELRDDANGRHAVRAKGQCLLHPAGARGSPYQPAGDGGYARAGDCWRPLSLCAVQALEFPD